MLDHVTLGVVDFVKSREFYRRALAPLGLAVLHEAVASETGGEAYAGFGEGRAFFWIVGSATPKGGAHVAFVATSRAQVEAFHREALAAGGRDNGGPGLRPHYDPDYYAAFVLDPDGNNIEAVCREAAANQGPRPAPAGQD